jgi:hypothetical protein
VAAVDGCVPPLLLQAQRGLLHWYFPSHSDFLQYSVDEVARMNETPIYIDKHSSPLTVRCSLNDDCQFSLWFV